MGKIQTRRTVSLSAPKFARLSGYAASLGRPLSQVVEAWIDEHIQAPELVAAPEPAPARNPRGKNPDSLTPRTINDGDARLVLAKRAAAERRLAVLDQAGDQLRASLPSREKVAEVQAPTRVEVPARRGGAVLL